MPCLIPNICSGSFLWFYHYLHNMSLVLSKSTGVVLVGGFQKSENIYSYAKILKLVMTETCNYHVRKKHDRSEFIWVGGPLVDICSGTAFYSFIHPSIHSFNKYLLCTYYGQRYSHKQTPVRTLSYILGYYQGEQRKGSISAFREFRG